MFFLKKGKFSSRLWAMTNNASKFGKIRCLCGGGRRLTPGKPAGVEEAELFRGQGEGDVLAEKQLAVEIDLRRAVAVNGDLLAAVPVNEIGVLGIEAVFVVADDGRRSESGDGVHN